MSSPLSSPNVANDGHNLLKQNALDLSHLPPLFVLPLHMDMQELHDLEDKLFATNAPLTYDVNEAQLFVGKVTQKRRAVLELRGKGVVTEELTDSNLLFDVVDPATVHSNCKLRSKKRRLGQISAKKVIVPGDGSETESDNDSVQHLGKRKRSSSSGDECEVAVVSEPIVVDPCVVQVVKLSWLQDSFNTGQLLSLKDYLTYSGKRTTEAKSTPTFARPTVPASKSQETLPTKSTTPSTMNTASAILSRARADAGITSTTESTTSFLHRAQPSHHPRPNLIHQTTSEHDLGHSSDLPIPPSWVLRHSTYSCERSTPLVTPNDAFIFQLLKIRLARTLTLDEIGVRAYSTSIASLQAYPYTVSDQREILRLPGCDNKIASLWVEWKNRNGLIQAVEDLESDEQLQVLRLFWEIWGVGAHTARDFYNKGWRDLDDIVEFGWNDLSRVQQIGVKYYDEFLLKLPRSEVEFIGRKVHEHAQRVRSPDGVRTCIVGGYRRGKKESGDVDVIVSHLTEDATLDLVTDIVKSLFDDGWITHELTTTLANSRRSQATTPFKADGSGGGHGFDTLDKSLVVWQDPHWEKSSKNPGEKEKEKNPNVHRRVDIIVAPWSKVGCAVMGWTAATTFERDLRRYAKRFKGWKFDSSGVRDRKTGEDVDLEGVGGRCSSVEEAERKVFAGFGLEYREPWDRCAG